MWYPMSSKIPVDTVTHFHTDKNNLLSRLDILVECMQLLIDFEVDGYNACNLSPLQRVQSCESLLVH